MVPTRENVQSLCRLCRNQDRFPSGNRRRQIRKHLFPFCSQAAKMRHQPAKNRGALMPDLLDTLLAIESWDVQDARPIDRERATEAVQHWVPFDSSPHSLTMAIRRIPLCRYAITSGRRSITELRGKGSTLVGR